MINLLLPVNRDALRKNYHRRRLIVAGTLLFVYWLMAAAVLASLYWLLVVEGHSLAQALVELNKKTDTTQFDVLKHTVAQTGDMVNLLATKTVEAPPLTALLVRLAADRPVGIKLKTIAYSATSLETNSLRLDGYAPSRQSLTAFVDTLKVDPTFREVNSPVSNIIRGKDLNFTLSLKLNPLTP